MKNILFSLILFVGLFTTSCEKTPVDVDLSGSYSGTYNITYTNCGLTNTTQDMTFNVEKRTDGDYQLNLFNICTGEKFVIPTTGQMSKSYNCNGTDFNVSLTLGSGKLSIETNANTNGCQTKMKGDFYK